MILYLRIYTYFEMYYFFLYIMVMAYHRFRPPMEQLVGIYFFFHVTAPPVMATYTFDLIKINSTQRQQCDHLYFK